MLKGASAIGIGSIAIGQDAKAGGVDDPHAVAIGYGAQAKAEGSVAIGYRVTVEAEGKYAHAEGECTATYKTGAHAEGGFSNA